MGNYLPCCRKDHEDVKKEHRQTLLKSPIPRVGKGNKYDLHGLSRDTALEKVKDVIRKKEKEVCWASQDLTIEFITGRGKHSRNHIPVIRNAVTDYLDDHYYE